MAPEFRIDEFEEPDEAYEADVRPRSWWSTCLVGCLVAAVAMIVVVGVLGFWVSRNWREWVASGGSEAIKQTIEQSDLPPQEKVEIGEQIDRLAEEFRSGRLSGDQLKAIVKMFMESPLATSLAVAVVEHKYFSKSGLSDEEKEAGRLTLRRFARGVIDRKIGEDEIEAALVHIGNRQPNGNWELRDQVSDDDLRAFLATARQQADAAGIVDEPMNVDPSDEMRRIIDQALGAMEAAQEAGGDESDGAAPEGAAPQAVGTEGAGR